MSCSSRYPNTPPRPADLHACAKIVPCSQLTQKLTVSHWELVLVRAGVGEEDAVGVDPISRRRNHVVALQRHSRRVRGVMSSRLQCTTGRGGLPCGHNQVGLQVLVDGSAMCGALEPKLRSSGDLRHGAAAAGAVREALRMAGSLPSHLHALAAAATLLLLGIIALELGACSHPTRKEGRGLTPHQSEGSCHAHRPHSCPPAASPSQKLTVIPNTKAAPSLCLLTLKQCSAKRARRPLVSSILARLTHAVAVADGRRIGALGAISALTLASSSALLGRAQGAGWANTVVVALVTAGGGITHLQHGGQPWLL